MAYNYENQPDETCHFVQWDNFILIFENNSGLVYKANLKKYIVKYHIKNESSYYNLFLVNCLASGSGRKEGNGRHLCTLCVNQKKKKKQMSWLWLESYYRIRELRVTIKSETVQIISCKSQRYANEDHGEKPLLFIRRLQS